MGEKGRSRSRSPHSIAATASLLILLVGFGVGAYFVELRGIGIQALLESEQLSEILVVCGLVTVVALVAQIAIASSIRSTGGSGVVDRRLLRRVFEMDPEDPELLESPELPSDMRELVRAVSIEKGRAREATHQLQVLRQEITELARGMERSVETRDPLREEQATETTARVARLWNGLMAQARASSDSGAAREPTTPGSTTSLTSGVAAVGVVSRDLDDVSQRLGRLEGDLEKLWDAVGNTGGTQRSRSPDSVLDLQRPELPPSFGDSARAREPQIPTEFGPPTPPARSGFDTPFGAGTDIEELEMPAAAAPPVFEIHEPGTTLGATAGTEVQGFETTTAYGSSFAPDPSELEIPGAADEVASYDGAPASSIREFDLSAAADEIEPFESTPPKPQLAPPPADLGQGAAQSAPELTAPTAPDGAASQPAAPRSTDNFAAPDATGHDAPESGYREWSGVGEEHHLGNLLRQEIDDAPHASTPSRDNVLAPPPQEHVGFGAPAESAAPLQSPGYSQHVQSGTWPALPAADAAYPDYGGGGPADRVAVTYDPDNMQTSTEMTDAQQLDGEYQKRAPGESMIVDLRSLGAVEFDD